MRVPSPTAHSLSPRGGDGNVAGGAVDGSTHDGDNLLASQGTNPHKPQPHAVGGLCLFCALVCVNGRTPALVSGSVTCGRYDVPQWAGPLASLFISSGVERDLPGAATLLGHYRMAQTSRPGAAYVLPWRQCS